MYKINGDYYELILEDEDKVVLSHSATGEPLVISRTEFWSRYTY